LTAETRQLYAQIYHEYGGNIGSTDSREIGPLLMRVGIDVPLTAAGNPSVQKEWLAGLDHPLGELLNNIREHEKICGTFLQSYILNKNINGKLHPQFHQLKGDENGTLVGRFSSSEPNLQNIPSRTKLGKRVRECFEPDPGHSHWQKDDYSQIHYRILAEFAVDDGDGSAEALRESYRNNPKMDYHQNVYENVAPLLGWDLADKELAAFRRRPIKNVNFGLLYGQSLKSLMYKTAMYFGGSFTQADAEAFFKAYFEGAPYVKPTMKNIGAEVQTYGFVKTILGRRIRFNTFEPNRKERWREYTALPYETALRVYGPAIKRAFEYRGVNYKFQGSEPDIMKHGMRDLWRSGVFEFTGVPRLTVHDELDFSVRDDSPQMREAFAFIKHTMENSLKLSVPIYVDESRGPNWGKAD
jgi:DNA polymerase I-like protein with 3'-5' exonuclease and polymerase domains